MDDSSWKDFTMATGIKICKLIHKICSPWMWLNQSGYINSSINFERTWTITNKCKWKHNMWTSLILICIQSPTLLWRSKWNFSSCQHHFIFRSFFVSFYHICIASNNPHKILFLYPRMNFHWQSILQLRGHVNCIHWLEIFNNKKCEVG